MYTCFQQTPSGYFAPRCSCIPKNNQWNFGIMSHVYKLTQLHHQNTVNYDLVVTVVNNAMLTATAVRAYNVSADTERHDNHVNCQQLCRHMFSQANNITKFPCDLGKLIKFKTVAVTNDNIILACQCSSCLLM